MNFISTMFGVLAGLVIYDYGLENTLLVIGDTSFFLISVLSIVTIIHFIFFSKSSDNVADWLYKKFTGKNRRF